MSGIVFSHRLDLLVRLTNAVTAEPITGMLPEFSKDGVKMPLREGPDHSWLGVNTGRTDFILGVNVRGFEKTEVPVRYENLDESTPVAEVNLIPEQSKWNEPPFVTLEGDMRGIEEIQAVLPVETDLYFTGFAKEACQLSIYNPHRKRLRYSNYAVVDQKRQEFEIFTVLKTLPDDMVQLNHGLKKKFPENSPIVRPVYGMVTGSRYLLRVPDISADAKWLVRFVAEGKETFEMVDIRSQVRTVKKRQSRTGKKE